MQGEGFAGMRGCGLLLVNPPFGLDQQLGALAPWLWNTLSGQRRGSWQASWLVPE